MLLRHRAMLLLLLSLSVITLAHAGHPERAGIGLMSDAQIKAMAGPRPAAAAAVAADAEPPTTLVFDRRRSLFITDENIVSQFSFAEVMAAVAKGAPASQRLTKEKLFRQWMDTLMPAPGLGLGPNCAATINGFANSCREGFDLPAGDPFTGVSDDDFSAIAIVNRFDLAGRPRDGATDCGEYRIVFARNSGKSDFLRRHLVIFEAVLPNPAPNGTDLSGCLPVAKFWTLLSATPSQAERALQLKNFFFVGLPGFEPVVTARHYGLATPSAKGQIRTNVFLNSPPNGSNIVTTEWTLREFFVSLTSTKLLIKQAAVDTSPPTRLFDESLADPKLAAFRTDFPKQVASLSINDINGFHMNTLPDKYDEANGIQFSEGAGPVEAMFSRRLERKSPLLQAAIQKKILLPSTLTPLDIAERAQAMTCSGCHFFSSGRSLGGGLVFPRSLGFVHQSESQQQMESSPDGGLRFAISPALKDVFLPHRERILKAFLGIQ